MDSLFELIPVDLIQFLLVLVFSISIGLEQHKRLTEDQSKRSFGTDRTFAFIGLLGYLLYISGPETKIPFLVGFVVLGLFLAIFYALRVKQFQRYGLTSPLLALITYGFPLLAHIAPHWMSLLFFVTVLVLAQIKKPLRDLSNRIAADEFISLAKFLVIAGVILPLIPNEVIFPKFFPVSPYKIWLAVVVVSGISYLSYLLRKYVFPQAGLLLTGILGGLYSSTATTVILARKSKEDDQHPRAYAGAILMATAMMFLRIYILILIFNEGIAGLALPYFIVLFFSSLAVGVGFYLARERSSVTGTEVVMDDRNPLEFKVALVFAALYVVFSVLTQFVVHHFGDAGLKILSVVVGFTDIDPFLLNLFQGQFQVAAGLIVLASLLAAASNNILKALYAAILCGTNTKKTVVAGFAVVFLFNVMAVAVLYGLL